MKYAQTTQDRLDESEGSKRGRKKKKQGAQARLDEAEGKKRGKTKTKDQKATHKMPNGKEMTGKKHSKDSKPVMEKIKVKGGVIKFKKGGLHDSLKVPESYKFTKAQIGRYANREVGDKIRIAGNTIEITKKIMRQIDLAKTLMGFKK